MEKEVIKKPKRTVTGDHLFKPGVSGNPKGRPLTYGGINSRKYAEVKSLATDNYMEMFKILLEKGLQGEAWAQQLYYREFIPKRARDVTVTLPMSDTSLDGQIKALTEALTLFQEVGEDEIKERLKLLTDIKKAAQEDAANNGGIIPTRIEVENKLAAVELMIEAKRKAKEHAK